MIDRLSTQQPAALYARVFSCPCRMCNETLFEAWERMMYGGVVVANEPDPFGENECPEWIPPYVAR